MHTIQVTFDDGMTRSLEVDTTVAQLMPTEQDADGLPYIAALVNNNLVSLTYPLTVNCTVSDFPGT